MIKTTLPLIISFYLALPSFARAEDGKVTCPIYTHITESHNFDAATFPVIDDDKIEKISDLFETTLEISGDNARERVISHALDWVNGLKAFRGIDHSNFRKILLKSRSKPFTFLEIGNYGKVAIVEQTRGATLNWALLVEHPDTRRNRFWRTNIGLSEESGGKLHLTIDLNLWSPVSLGPQPSIARTAPRFVAAILRDSKLKAYSGSMPVSIKATHLKAEEVESFINSARDPNRILPIVLLSLIKQSGRPAVDPDKLAETLKGLANVFVEADAQNCRAFADRMDNFAPELATSNGFIRVIGRDGEVLGVWNPLRNQNLLPEEALTSVSRLVVARTILDVTAEAEHRLTSIFDILRDRRR